MGSKGWDFAKFRLEGGGLSPPSRETLGKGRCRDRGRGRSRDRGRGRDIGRGRTGTEQRQDRAGTGQRHRQGQW